MAKKTKKDSKPKTPKKKTTEDRLSEALKILASANKVLGHAEVFIQRMKELEDAIRKFASFIERDDVTIDRNEMANTLYGIANTIEEAMEV